MFLLIKFFHQSVSNTSSCNGILISLGARSSEHIHNLRHMSHGAILSIAASPHTVKGLRNVLVVPIVHVLVIHMVHHFHEYIHHHFIVHVIPVIVMRPVWYRVASIALLDRLHKSPHHVCPSCLLVVRATMHRVDKSVSGTE